MKEVKINVEVNGSGDVENLNKSITDLDNNVKSTDSTSKAFSGTLKDVTNITNNLPGPLGKISKGLGSMANRTTALANGIQGMTARLGLLRVALISTGIGAIVVLLGSLAGAFLSTQRGVDALNKVLTPVSFVFQRLVGLVQELSQALADGSITNFIRILRGAKGELEDAARAGVEYVNTQIALEEAVNDSIVPLARLSVEYEKNRAQLEDATLAVRERIEAGKDAIANIEEDIAIRKELLETEIRQLEVTQGLNDTNREGNKEYQELLASLIQLEAEEERRILRINRTVGRLEEQQRKERELEAEQRRIAAEREAEEARREEERNAKEEADFQARQQRLREREELARAQLQALRTQELEDEIEFRRVQMEQELLDEELTESERLLLQERFAQMEVEMRDKHAEELQKIEDQKLKEEEKALKERQALLDAEAQARIENANIVANTMIGLSRLAGEQTAVGKGLAVASSFINTYQGATKALAQGGIFGPVAAAGVIASGLASVRAIMRTQIPNVGGGFGSSTATPAFNTPTAPDVQPDEGGVVETVFDNEDQRVYVVESDITSTQRRVEVIEGGAQF